MTTTLYLSVVGSCVYMCAAPDVGLRPEYCGPGYFGLFCADICPHPYYGKYCDHTCNCSKPYCSHVIGCIPAPVSSCPNGFMGIHCKSKCSFPLFGQGCQQKCLCTQEDCHFSTGCPVKHTCSKNPTTNKKLPSINKVTAKKISSTPMTVTTFPTQAQSTETTSEASLECKTMPLGKGISSGIFSFIRNREMKASKVALCILFILLVIAHIILYIVQRINVKNNSIPV